MSSPDKRKTMRAFLTSALCVLLLSACGFQPLYGTHGLNNNTSVQQGLDHIAIGNIPNEEGLFLRNLLIDRFYVSGRPASPRYQLDIAPLVETRRDLDITKSSSATRAQLRIDSAMQLTDLQTGEIVLNRRLSSITSYNVLQSQFTTRVSQKNARDSALQDIARQIELQTALYLRRTP